MIILYQSNPEVKKILDELLATGRYSDYSEIISLAVMNLAVLQREVGEDRDILIEGFTNRDELIVSGNTYQGDDYPQLHSAINEPQHFTGNIPLLKSLVTSEPPFMLIEVDEEDNPPQEVSVDQWIFGQHNRLLPAKVSCRAIANLMMEESHAISLSQYSNTIATSAAMLAQKLRRIDKKYNLKRDVALSTAFPTAGKRKHKSIERFISQFIAQTTREGNLTGLLADLKLIRKIPDTTDSIVLTDPGWVLATLSNPILDGSDSEPPNNLSEGEKEYLINHIITKVPVERAAFKAILDCILAGSNTPTLIDEALRETIPEDKVDNFSESFLSSQRSGAISRMADLDIVRRERDGIFVKYSITPTSDVFIENKYYQ